MNQGEQGQQKLLREIERDNKRGKVVLIIIALIASYFGYKALFPDPEVLAEKQEKKVVAYSDSAERAIKVLLARPDTYEFIKATNAIQFGRSKYWVREMFRFKDWKENYTVCDMTVYMDSTGHAYDFKVNSVE